MMMQPNVIEGFRLSPQQRRLWSLHNDAPNAYVVQGCVHIFGPLDQAALEAAVRQVVARHEILRTSFQCLPGMKVPVQVIAAEPALTLAHHDLSALAEPEQMAIEALLAEMRQPAPVDCESLLRLALVALPRQQHTLLISFPALCGDATTLKNLVQELGAAYAESTADLDDEPMQYADFAEWQHSLLEEAGDVPPVISLSEQDLATLRGLRLPLEQSTAAPFAPRTAAVPFAPESVDRLAAFAQQNGISEAVCLLAGYYALLWRLTQQPEIIVGVGYDGRTYDDLQAALGLFAKSLPVRAQLDTQTTFGALVAQLAQTVGEAGEAQDEFFWERIDAASGSAPAFFPLSFELTDLSTPAATGTRLTLARLDSYTDRFKLKLAAAKRHDDLDLTLHYDAALFSHAEIAGFAQMLQTLLDHALVQPEQPIAALPLLSVDERQRLLHSFNATQAAYPADRSFGELFEQQAARTPDAIAASFAGTRERVQTLTYAELNARANQLARHLRKQGIAAQDEARIGVYLPRSLDLLVASLAIFKAGGVYLPLDPAFPQSHLATILADSQARAILTNETLDDTLPEHTAALVRLDRDWPAIEAEPSSNLDCNLQPRSAAYVIYTSGSTGQPKGVVVEHRSLINYLYWVNHRLLGGQECQLPAVTRLTFDASLKQLFAPLLRGAEVWLLSDEILNEPETLLHTLATRSNVALNCVPSLWTTLLDIASEQQLAQLDQQLAQLFVGGEQLTPELVTRSLAALPRLQIWNLYGPTETTANASAARIAAADAITIGTPLSNTQIYLLDAGLQPVPVGVIGNLYVGGISVARGYLNRPDATAEKFIPDSFASEPGARLYHTGDLARYRPDGTLEFVGRSDFQVKLRGLRIELGAIEAALSRYPGVRESVVVVRDENLVAYVVENKEQRQNQSATLSPSPAAARVPSGCGDAGGEGLLPDLPTFLQTQLPAYMVPAMIVPLDALPLSPNGKLDRAALPVPGSTRPTQTREFVAPRNAIEAALASIWAEILDLDQVGVYDNFFALGGHSLLATRLAARVRKIFRVELPLRALFDVATIAELAEVLVARESRPGQVAKIANLLQQIKAMPAEEISETLHSQQPASGE